MKTVHAIIMLALCLFYAGCASTRLAPVGPLPDHEALAGTLLVQTGLLPNHEPLVILIVTKELGVVHHECPAGAVSGCELSRAVDLQDGLTVRTMKIVRYAEVLPSPGTFETDVYELCHAVAAQQPIQDPCPAGRKLDARYEASAGDHD